MTSPTKARASRPVRLTQIRRFGNFIVGLEQLGDDRSPEALASVWADEIATSIEVLAQGGAIEILPKVFLRVKDNQDGTRYLVVEYPDGDVSLSALAADKTNNNIVEAFRVLARNYDGAVPIRE